MAKIKAINQIQVLALLSILVQVGQSCRVNSERLKIYTKRFIVNLLDPDYLEAIYWAKEPLESDLLSNTTGLNIVLAETHFQLNGANRVSNTIDPNNGILSEYFVTCSIDRDKTHVLTFNLELENPFKQVEIWHEMPSGWNKAANKSESKSMMKKFHIDLPDSEFSIQLSQRIKYDECLEIDHIQLTPTTAINIDCYGCNADEQGYLNDTLNKRMTPLRAELESLLSERLLLGLKLLFNQQRLDLELDLE